VFVSLFKGLFFMAKVADVRLTWSKSPSLDITSQVIVLSVDGGQTEIEVDKAIESYTLEVQANQTVTFSISSFDSEGNVAASESHTFQLGDLELPLPATGLFHEVVAVRDVEE
jgi:hypothetical protein